MKHVSTEGIEFESSPGPVVDWEGVVFNIKDYFARYPLATMTHSDFLRQLAAHTPKPETLEDVVREYCSGPVDPKRYSDLFDKMRTMVGGKR